jgi:endogenous inhibitor of DNA gyrase (YacG/DUF329 family)
MTVRECANPTCTTTIPADAPPTRAFCERRCQVATLNSRGRMTIRLGFTADEMHTLEDYVAREYPDEPGGLEAVIKALLWWEVAT